MNHAAHYPGVANSSPKPIPDLNYAFAQTAMSVAACTVANLYPPLSLQLLLPH